MTEREATNIVMRCSFCARPDSRVTHLVAGPRGIYICDTCIDACARIIAEARAAAS